MGLWIYKCNTNARGDWMDCFRSMARSKDGTTEWGGSDVGAPEALALSAKVGQQFLCWQNWQPNTRPPTVHKGDRAAAVGIVEITDVRVMRNGVHRWRVQTVEEFNPPVALLRSRETYPVINELFTDPQRRKTFHDMSAACERAVLQACGLGKKADKATGPKNPPSGAKGNGAGFGDPQTNREVERKAVDFVWSQLADQGYALKSVEPNNCGYDIEAKKANRTRHIEVKGVSGTMPSFIITENEVRISMSDPKWEVWIVTGARSAHPVVHQYSGKELDSKFELTPISYRAVKHRTHK